MIFFVLKSKSCKVKNRGVTIFCSCFLTTHQGDHPQIYVNFSRHPNVHLDVFVFTRRAFFIKWEPWMYRCIITFLTDYTIYSVFPVNDPFSTSSQGRIFQNIDMRFVANCRYIKRDFFSYRIHEDTLKIVEMRVIWKKSSENRKHLVLWKSYTYLLTFWL